MKPLLDILFLRLPNGAIFMFNPNDIALALYQELGPEYNRRGAKVWYRKPMRFMPYLRVLDDGRIVGSRGQVVESSWDLSEPDSIDRAVAWLRGFYV